MKLTFCNLNQSYHRNIAISEQKLYLPMCYNNSLILTNKMLLMIIRTNGVITLANFCENGSYNLIVQ